MIMRCGCCHNSRIKFSILQNNVFHPNALLLVMNMIIVTRKLEMIPAATKETNNTKIMVVMVGVPPPEDAKEGILKGIKTKRREEEVVVVVIILTIVAV